METLLYWFFTLSGVGMMFASTEMSSKAAMVGMVVLGFIVLVGVQQIDFRSMEDFNE